MENALMKSISSKILGLLFLVSAGTASAAFVIPSPPIAGIYASENASDSESDEETARSYSATLRAGAYEPHDQSALAGYQAGGSRADVFDPPATPAKAKSNWFSRISKTWKRWSFYKKTAATLLGLATAAAAYVGIGYGVWRLKYNKR
jgi:hypothetical protein